jgi:membrane protease YdiL (CAAX protease family)
MLDAYRNTAWPPLFWIAVVIFAPAFEEFLFRGFSFIGLQKSRLGSAGATILTALVWAVLHIQYNWLGGGILIIE